MNKEVTWNILNKYFDNNKRALIDHHLESYNLFFGENINQIFREKNPMKIIKEIDFESSKQELKAYLYLGGKEANKIYFGKPIIYDEDKIHYMYPNEARLRNMTYGITIHYDIDVEFYLYDQEGNKITENTTLEKIYLGKFPIMLQSNLCILKEFNKEIRFGMGECRNDLGGYFIIDGKEKAIISQEKFADNMIYLRDKVNEIYSHSADIRMVSEDSSKPVRTLSIRIVSPNSKLQNGQIVVNVPNIRTPVPLFILMRALGIHSDKKIIECCLLNLEKNKNLIDLFIPSVYDAGIIFNQETALKYIATFTKGKTIANVMEILTNYLLPNIGELNYRDKALYIGYMVYKLLLLFTGQSKATDRDSFKYKRVEIAGELIYDLFKEYYIIQFNDIFKKNR